MSELLFIGLLFIFILSTAIQLAFGFFFMKRADRASTKATGTIVYPDVSIIICARNEADHLTRFLPEILNQEYPHAGWEVIVVNDRSTDNTDEVLSLLQKKYDRLRIRTIDAATQTIKLPGKKAALHTGILQARYATLLLTDADCRPKTTRWIRHFAERKAASGKKIILGYGAYRQIPGCLNKCIRWETVHTALQYFSFARRGAPYMGVGRNLMYEKSLYLQCLNDPAFVDIYQKTLSGDDDLLVSHMSNKENTGILTAPGSHTESLPAADWETWWRQKSRHVTTGKYYPVGIRRYLGVYALSHALFWFFGFLLLITTACFGRPLMLVPILFLFFWRNALYWINMHHWQKSLDEPRLFYFSLIGDFGWAIYNVFLSPFIFWKGRKTWK